MPTQLSTRLQHDYLRAYLDFYAGELADARRIAEGYAEHPVARWRTRFRAVLAQLDEAEGVGIGVGGVPEDPGDRGDPAGRDREQWALAASEPSLELAVEARRVKLTSANIDRCAVSYREMDIELLFSTNPFLQSGSTSFAFVKPQRVDLLELGAQGGASGRHEFDLPEEFRNSNVLVEVRAGGRTRRQTYFANDLAVQGIENYGQLRVRGAESGKLLPGAYVKVYARLANGQVRFHKDGYTDIRGRFDYVSLSGMDDAEIVRFAVLIMSAEHGALVRELGPPTE